jgi:hypothetical protein
MAHEKSSLSLMLLKSEKSKANIDIEDLPGTNGSSLQSISHLRVSAFGMRT